ncbi:MAG: SpaA isopeptide-forming pilin-related protein [Candidatus Riflebacteria bacterium]
MNREQGTGTEIPAADITWDDADKDGSYQLKATPQISQLDGYNEYRVKVFYNGTAKILEGVKYLKTTDKTGTQNLEVSPTSTAKALVFDTWKNKATTDTYQTFEFNLGNTDISAVVTQVTTEFAKTSSTVAPDYTTAAVTTEVNTVSNNTPTAEVVTTYSISGFVTAADGLSGQTDAMMTLYRKADRQMVAETMTNSGNYTLTNVPDGTYVLVPTKANHSYNPLEREVTVNGANLTGVNFQATFAPSIR